MTAAAATAAAAAYGLFVCCRRDDSKRRHTNGFDCKLNHVPRRADASGGRVPVLPPW